MFTPAAARTPSAAAIITCAGAITEASPAAYIPCMFVLPNESTAIPPSGLYSHPNCLPKSDDCINWGITKPPFLDTLSPISKVIFSICPDKVFNFVIYYFYSLILKQNLFAQNFERQCH